MRLGEVRESSSRLLKRIADSGIVAITLMFSESAPDQREILDGIIVEIINDRD
jgi:hypothetical protein